MLHASSMRDHCFFVLSFTMSQFSLAAIVTHTCKPQQAAAAMHSVHQPTALLPNKQLHSQVTLW
jgi:hypothetical protein